MRECERERLTQIDRYKDKDKERVGERDREFREGGCVFVCV